MLLSMSVPNWSCLGHELVNWCCVWGDVWDVWGAFERWPHFRSLVRLPQSCAPVVAMKLRARSRFIIDVIKRYINDIDNDHSLQKQARELS